MSVALTALVDAGIMPWLDHPSDPLMRPGISPLAKAIPALTPYVLGGKSIVSYPTVSGARRVDVTAWTNNGKTLLIALNLNNASVEAQVSMDASYGKPNAVFENGAQVTPGGKTVQIRFQPLSSIAVVF
jgi:hypothetical protein